MNLGMAPAGVELSQFANVSMGGRADVRTGARGSLGMIEMDIRTKTD